MKVLLLNPPAAGGIRYVREGRCEQRVSSFQYNMPPISLLTTAALLRREGHKVLVVDAVAEHLAPPAVVAAAAAFAPGLVLVNVATATFPSDARTAEALRAALPGAFIAAYGIHVTALPGESLREAPALDAVIRREPEATAAELAARLAASESPATVAGISWRTSEGLQHNDDRHFIEDLDALPFPALDLVDPRRYPAPVDGRPHTLVITSRGCPHRCTFCTAHLYYGTKPRLRDPARIAAEIEVAAREHGLRLFTFWADTFTIDRGQVLGICREIRRRALGIEWMANARVDCVDRELLGQMREAGCTIVSFGVESGAQEILDRTRKGVRVEQIEEAFAACRAVGLRSAAHVILGLPGETPATIRETLRLVRRLRPSFVQFYGAVPFPGTAFHREATEHGWIVARDWSDYEINRGIVSTPDLSAGALRSWRRRAYLSIYLAPRFLAENLGRVRSARELFRLARAGIGLFRGWVFPGK
ncbi:MAG TPA: radical SAM protein [Candidatus Methanoperedens sp.]|nr:radical SAM protein [Candidatus Methanoperedens sp.]